MTEQLNYFKAFCKISQAFGSTLDKDALLHLVVENATHSMQAKAACLFMADEEAGLSVPVAQYGLSANYLHAGPRPMGSAIKELFENGGHVYFRDALADPRSSNVEAKRREGIASILAVPVMIQERPVGVLSLYTATERDFSSDDIEFLGALAEQGAMAIEQARLLARIKNDAALFYKMASTINSSRDLSDIFRVLSKDISTAYGLKGVTIRFFNPKTQQMDLKASFGLSERFLNKGPVLASNNPVVQQILAGETVLIEDVASDPRIQYPAASTAEGIAAALCVPIKSREKVMGEMRLYSRTRRTFPDYLVDVINALGHQGGIAIENAHLLQQLHMNTQLFHDLAVNVNSTLNIERILNILSADVAEIFDVQGLSIHLLDSHQPVLQRVVYYGLSENYLAGEPAALTLRSGHKLPREIQIIPDVAQAQDLPYRELKLAEGIVSMLVVPIHARDDIIGVMKLYSQTARQFTEDDIMMATAIAHQGGLAIQNASMYLTLQEDKRSLEQDVWSHRAWF